MLGGLLCDLLGVNRWAVFHQAIKSKPICSGRYNLTGDRRRDERLSGILNRAWRGDAGGALLVANGGRGEQGTYDDARELLADVLGSARPGRQQGIQAGCSVVVEGRAVGRDVRAG